jgi:hypothetical protein
MSDHLRLKKRAVELFGTGEDLARALNDQQMLARLQEARERLDAGKLYVVVCGEYKRGKSSLINALLEEDGLCPVGADITTALVTIIQYGQRSKYTLFSGEPGRETRAEISREEIENYVTGKKKPPDTQTPRLLVVEVPNPRLREGLVVVDTPGVGGVNARHTDITYAFIPKADAVLFVTDPTPVANPEREFLKLVDRHCKHVLFLVCKMDGDAGRKSTGVIAENRAKLAADLGRPAESLTFIPVSSRTKLEYLQSRDEQDLADSGFPTLERELWRLLSANRGRVLLASALVKLARGLEDLREPLAAELTAADQEDRAKAEALEADYKAAVQRLTHFQESQAGWRTQLNDGLSDVVRAARGQFGKGFRDIERRAAEYLRNDRYLNSPEQIPAMLETDIDALMAEVQATMERSSAELHGRLEDATGLSLQRAAVQALEFDTVAANIGDTKSVRSSGWQKTMMVGREAAFTASAGATLGGVFGVALGGVLGFFTGGLGALPGAWLGAKIGAFFGAVAGKTTGLTTSLGRVKRSDQAAVLQLVRPAINAFLEDNKVMGNDSLTEAQHELQRSMRDELENRLKEERRKCEQVLQRIKEARARPASENATRVPALKGSLKRVNDLHAEVVRLGIQATDAPPETPNAGVAKLPPPPPKAPGEGDRGGWADG